MIIYGINTIRACLEKNSLLKVMVSKEFSNRSLLNSIKEKGIKIELTTKEKINELAPGVNQGICGYIKDVEPLDLTGLINKAKKQESNGITPLIVILDQLTDPHNLGAILRKELIEKGIL